MLYKAFLLLLLAVSTAVCAQQESLPVLAFQHLTTEDGLSSNNVWALRKDDYGYVWAGTENGLNRFDGSFCIPYYPITGDTASLPGAFVQQILPTGQGDLWVGTQAGLARYQRIRNAFQRLDFGTSQPQYIFPFFVDNARRLWLYLGAKGAVFTYNLPTGQLDSVTSKSNGHLFAQQPLFTPLRRYVTRAVKGIYITGVADGKHIRSTPFFTGEAGRKQPVTFIDQVLWEGDTVLWLCADVGLIRLAPATGAYRIFDAYQDRHVDANCIVPLDANRFFIGTSGEGLLCFDRVKQRFCGQYRHFPEDAQSLSGNIIYRAMLDSSGNLFLAVADHGIDYANVQQAVFRPYLGRAEAAAANVDNNITAVAALPQEGWILAGTSGSGLLLYEVPTGKVLRRLLSGNITALTPLDNTGILVQAGNRFFLYNVLREKATSLQPHFSLPMAGVPEIHHIGQLHDGTLLAATAQGLARLHISGNTLSFHFEKSIAAATEWNNYQFVAPLNDSLLLLQTYSTNLYLLSYKNGRLEVLREIARTPFRIHGLALTEGTAFLATSAGMYRYLLAAGRLETQPEAITTPCQGIVAAPDGALWVSTTAGIYRYEPRTRHSDRFTRHDGLQNNLFSPGSLVGTVGGNILAGGVNGLNFFNPHNIRAANTKAGVAVHSILVNDRPFSDTLNPAACTSLHLSFGKNNLTFSFNAIDYGSPGQKPVSYKLIGYDSKAIETKGRGTARYPQLPPGAYRFVVSTDGGTQSIAVIIDPPWWQRWWARAGTLLILAGIGVTVGYLRIRALKRRQTEHLALIIQSGEDERRRIARDLHDDFGARLSTLKLYLQAAHKNPDMLGHSAVLIDESMRELRNILLNLSPRTLEENGLQAALSDLAGHVSNSGTIRCEADVAGFPQRLKPRAEFSLYRIAQELINNTLKYAGAKHIYLSLVGREESLIFLYEDDGRGFDSGNVRRGYGLTNIETHVRALAGSMTLDTAVGRGLAVTIEIPLRGICANNT